MGIIIILAILAAITIACFFILPQIKMIEIGYQTDDNGEYVRDRGNRIMEYKGINRWFTLIPAAILVIVTLICSVTQVHAKEIGVVTSFGQPVSEVGSGLHMIWPWQDVTKIDETINSDTYSADNKTDIPVRLGDGNTATVDATIRWHVNPDAADYIYRSYRSNNPTDQLKNAVVDTQFRAAVNQVASGFNPTANVESLNFSPDYIGLAKSVTTSMLTRVKDADGTSLVVIDGITVAGIHYSQATEDRINSIISQAAKTQQAIQAEKTARAQAAANNILSDSLAKNPYVLVSKCLDELAAGAFTAPVGFQCWPNTGGSVVIPGSK